MVLVVGKAKKINSFHKYSFRKVSGVLGDKNAGGISKTVKAPFSPFCAKRCAALAYATKTLDVNSGLESSFKENSMM